MNELERVMGSINPSHAVDSRMVDDDLSDHIPNSFILNRSANSLGTYGDSVRIEKNPTKNVVDEIETMLVDWKEQPTITYLGKWMTFIATKNMFIKVGTRSNSVKIEVIGDKSEIKNFMNAVHEKFNVVAMTVEWVYAEDMSTASIPLIEPKGIYDSSYPFITEGLNNFVDAFLESTENVLILIGPPGTGKSSLIQYLIARSGRNAMVTYDPQIMKKDEIFASFLESECGSFIMEDADAFLISREDGNVSMHKFLNVSSGIVSMPGKKIIFSTNLETADEIDPALLRPGRCFGLIQFRKLTQIESQKFLKDQGSDQVVTESHTLAELYNMSGRARTQARKTIGFI